MHIHIYNQNIQFSVSIRNHVHTPHISIWTFRTVRTLIKPPQTFLWFARHVAYEEHAEVLVRSFICRYCETHCRVHGNVCINPLLNSDSYYWKIHHIKQEAALIPSREPHHRHYWTSHLVLQLGVHEECACHSCLTRDAELLAQTCISYNSKSREI